MTDYYITRKSEFYKVFELVQDGTMNPHKQGKNYNAKQINCFIATAKAKGSIIRTNHKSTLEDMI